MADHTITFSPEQSLLLDKLVSEKQKLVNDLAALQAQVENKQDQIKAERAANSDLRQQLSEAIAATGNQDEEATRASERERIALWFAAGGHEPQYVWDFVDNVSQDVPYLIRDAAHNMTYFEYRKEIDPDGWPDDYSKGPDDYEFDVHTRVWER